MKTTLVTFNNHYWLWVLPTLVMTIGAAGYAIVRPEAWSCSQALVVREEASGNDQRLGRFDSVDSMKAFQETILEVARSRDVIAASLKKVAPPANHSSPGEWPTVDDIEAMQKHVTVSAPKGAEFGRTEVIYIGVIGHGRQDALDRNAALCDQVQKELSNLRNTKAGSVIVELEESLRLATHELNDATERLETMEREVGNDLGELRSLNESGAGSSNLRAALNEVKTELRQATSAMEANQQLHDLLVRAQDDANELLATPSRLLESQPSLRRLKEGLVDAQLRTAKLRGKMRNGHPLVVSAERSEDEVRQNLHAEIASSLRGLEGDGGVVKQRLDALTEQHADLQARLNRVAGLRVRYSNLVDDVRQRNEIIQQAQRDLADMRASRNAALSTSLLTRFNAPVVGDVPDGPATVIVIAAGLAGGLATGVGLVFLLVPPGGVKGRRWADYLEAGRRATDRLLGRRASDDGNSQQSSSKVAGDGGRETPRPDKNQQEAPLDDGTLVTRAATENARRAADHDERERRQTHGRRSEDGIHRS
ncbi:MAG: hypothetical protein QGG71_03330 [Pirellulaceae bacterium]|nr:hypothetical protein [Pirellulaceae bacterium]